MISFVLCTTNFQHIFYCDTMRKCWIFSFLNRNPFLHFCIMILRWGGRGGETYNKRKNNLFVTVLKDCQLSAFDLGIWVSGGVTKIAMTFSENLNKKAIMIFRFFSFFKDFSVFTLSKFQTTANSSEIFSKDYGCCFFRLLSCHTFI